MVGVCVCVIERVWKRERERERGQIDRCIHLLMQLSGCVCACVCAREYVEGRKGERESARTQIESWIGLVIEVCVRLRVSV